MQPHGLDKSRRWRHLVMTEAPWLLDKSSAEVADLKWHIEVIPLYQMNKPLSLQEDMTRRKPCYSVAQWLVPNAHTCRAPAVVDGFVGRDMVQVVEAAVAVDILVVGVPTFSELLAEIELVSSCVVQCLPLAWLDMNTLCQLDQPFQ